MDIQKKKTQRFRTKLEKADRKRKQQAKIKNKNKSNYFYERKHTERQTFKDGKICHFSLNYE